MEGSTNKCYVKVSSLFIVISFSFGTFSSHQSPLIFLRRVFERKGIRCRSCVKKWSCEFANLLNFFLLYLRLNIWLTQHPHFLLLSQHKLMMTWVYDKRPRNGSAFVYFGMLPIDPMSEEAKLLIPYTRGVLDALGMAHGPSHGEVIITKDGPCLVEMNCRAHGGDGNWAPLGRALTGGKYCQIEATAAAYLDEEEFNKLPDQPLSPLQAHGLEVNLVSYSKGKVKSMPGFDVIKKLPSFVWFSPATAVGKEVNYTTDLITSPGGVILMNTDDKVLQKDLEFIRYLEEINGLFIYETKGESLARPTAATFGVGTLPAGKKGSHRRAMTLDRPNLLRIMSQDRPELRGGLMKKFTTIDASKEVVIVVDPYSTGCLIVNEIKSRGPIAI